MLTCLCEILNINHFTPNFRFWSIFWPKQGARNASCTISRRTKCIGAKFFSRTIPFICLSQMLNVNKLVSEAQSEHACLRSSMTTRLSRIFNDNTLVSGEVDKFLGNHEPDENRSLPCCFCRLLDALSRGACFSYNVSLISKIRNSHLILKGGQLAVPVPRWHLAPSSSREHRLRSRRHPHHGDYQVLSSANLTCLTSTRPRFNLNLNLKINININIKINININIKPQHHYQHQYQHQRQPDLLDLHQARLPGTPPGQPSSSSSQSS